jgi:hypothetical protein
VIRKPLDSAEKALLWSCTVFAMLALLMILGPYIVTYCYTRGIEDSGRAFRAGAALGMTFGLLILAAGVFTWLASLTMIVVTLLVAPEALRSRHGTFLKVLNAAILAYGIFFLTRL